jgi:hypothetical protein
MRAPVSALVFAACAWIVGAAAPSRVPWTHLSSARGELPVPGPSTQQTGAVVGDFDKDGVVEFILSFREKPPALVWYRRAGCAWTRQVIEPAYLTVEAGGAVHDIDGDGDLDVVFGGDWQSTDVWWWENPHPTFDRHVRWVRHTIKTGSATQHHDQVFGDFLGTGSPQLAFWNQGAKTLFLARVPSDPRAASSWPAIDIHKGHAGEGAAAYAEGIDAADVDGDGRVDLLAGNMWFKHEGGTRFRAIRIGEQGGRIAAGRFAPGQCPQIVIAPGDGVGPLTMYSCVGGPSPASAWVGRPIGPRPMVHGHTLAVGDIDRDGHLDVFAAEMTKWHEKASAPDHPDAEAWILYGDGAGGFTREVLARGVGFHEGRLADLNGDGLLDILQKPYTWEAPRVDVWIQRAKGRGPKAEGGQWHSHQELRANTAKRGQRAGRSPQQPQPVGPRP